MDPFPSNKVQEPYKQSLKIHHYRINEVDQTETKNVPLSTADKRPKEKVLHYRTRNQPSKILELKHRYILSLSEGK